jgi:hypothetical protein
MFSLWNLTESKISEALQDLAVHPLKPLSIELFFPSTSRDRFSEDF